MSLADAWWIMVHHQNSSKFELRACVRRWTIELALLAASTGVFIVTEVLFALGCALFGTDCRTAQLAFAVSIPVTFLTVTAARARVRRHLLPSEVDRLFRNFGMTPW